MKELDGHEAFRNAHLCMRDAECVFVQHPIQNASNEEIRNKADLIVDEIIRALTK